MVENREITIIKWKCFLFILLFNYNNTSMITTLKPKKEPKPSQRRPILININTNTINTTMLNNDIVENVVVENVEYKRTIKNYY